MENGLVSSDNIQKEVSIFEQDYFPAKTRPISFSPKQLQEMLIEYSRYRGSIVVLCKEHGVDTHTFFDLCRAYPDIAQFYDLCKENRAEIMAAETIDIVDSTDNDVIMNVDKAGTAFFSPNMAAVRRDELRIKQRNFLLSKYNRDKYGERQVIEQTTKSFNIHAHTLLPSPDKLEEIGLEGLINIQRDMRYGQASAQQSGAVRR